MEEEIQQLPSCKEEEEEDEDTCFISSSAAVVEATKIQHIPIDQMDIYVIIYIYIDI